MKAPSTACSFAPHRMWRVTPFGVATEPSIAFSNKIAHFLSTHQPCCVPAAHSVHRTGFNHREPPGPN